MPSSRGIYGMALNLRRLGLVLWFCCSVAGAQEAQTILHLLDYIGVDYAEAVERWPDQERR